jgi:hypothetical protein
MTEYMGHPLIETPPYAGYSRIQLLSEEAAGDIAHSVGAVAIATSPMNMLAAPSRAQRSFDRFSVMRCYSNGLKNPDARRDLGLKFAGGHS